MLIGTMNHPGHDVLDDIRWMAEMALEFVDLTLEPPAAASWEVKPRAIRRALDDLGMKVVGHTAYYLPIASPFEGVRKAAVEELRHCIDIFAEIGACCMNIHPDRFTPFQSREFFIGRNLESLRELLPAARERGVAIMVENLPGEFNSAAQLAELLDPLPELALHLDFAHANLLVSYNTSDEILARFGRRLRHVHLHDNKGGHEDMHAPLGVGNVDVRHTVEALKRCGYDGTITLEVFTPDRHYLAYSRDVLRRAWDEFDRPW
jgi:sugar phosphate isomerase/epimerase